MEGPDYVYIRAWARFMGWPSERTAAMLRAARMDHAPDDACYKAGLHWIRYPDLVVPGARIRVEKLADAVRRGH